MAASDAAVSIPSVGCASDGQTGPEPSPQVKPILLRIAPEQAARLNYYKASDGVGVLAPKGWHCFATYGSNGSALYVSPAAIEADAVLSPNWKGFAGPAIELAISSGGTSGRLAVATTIARVFPNHLQFVCKVVGEGIAPASSFPSGPYPHDHLIYRDINTVEFVTPPRTEGLGTDSRLLAGSDPIEGVAMLKGKDTDLVQLSARVPPQLQDLLPAITKQVEEQAARAKD